MMLFWPQLCHDFKIKSLRKTERERDRKRERQREREREGERERKIEYLLHI